MKENIKKLERKFKELKKMVINLLDKECITAADVAFELAELPASEVEEHESFFKDHLSELQKYTNNKSLFSYMNCYWNYLSPQLLYHLVEELPSCREAKGEMESYDKNLYRFRNFTLLSLFCATDKDTEHNLPSKGFSDIVAKFEVTHDTTLQHVEEFRVKYAKHFKLRKFAFILSKKMMLASFIVSFSVPNSVTDRLRSDVPIDLLKEFGITQFEVAGTIVYNNALSQSSVTLYPATASIQTTSVPHPVNGCKFICNTNMRMHLMVCLISL